MEEVQRKELVCIGCPLGCAVTVELSGGQVGKITGNTCPRGAEYARKELTDPRRIVTSVVQVEGGELAVGPVKTLAQIPRAKVMDCVGVLKGIRLQAPVHRGDVVVENVCGTGVDVAATGEGERAR